MVKHREVKRYRSHNWCFTYNIGKEEDKDKIIEEENYKDLTDAVIEALWKSKQITYSVFQLELGPKRKNIHFQGYVHYKNAVEFKFVNKIFGNDGGVYWGNMWSTAEKCRNYCMKEDTRIKEPIEIGECPDEGKRTDLLKCRDFIYKADSWKKILANDEHQKTIARYFGWAEAQYINRPLPKYEEEYGKLILKDWMIDVLEIVAKPPHPRYVYWFCDTQGGAGKSDFSAFLCMNFEAQLLPSNYKEAVYIYDNSPIVIFDFERDTNWDFVSYGAIEVQKNKIAINMKYRSGNKFNKKHHVLVFANALPNKTKMSADRWQVYDIVNEKLILHKYTEVVIRNINKDNHDVKSEKKGIVDFSKNAAPAYLQLQGTTQQVQRYIDNYNSDDDIAYDMENVPRMVKKQ